MKCPECGSKNVRKSHWLRDESGGYRAVFSPYRCRDCRHRFHRVAASFKYLCGIAVVAVAVVGFIGFMLSASLSGDDSLAHFTDEEDRAAIMQVTKRAERGDATSQHRLGLMYLNGDRVGQDYHQAIRWFEAAARQDHTLAQYNLGLMFRSGRGTLQDYAAAARWFDKAAHLGSPEAQHQLGTLHKVGLGVKHDTKRAYVWYNLAAAKGYDPAISARDALATFMNVREIAEAQELSKGWQPGAKDFLPTEFSNSEVIATTKQP